MSPRADDIADFAKLVPLDEARPLSAGEHALLRALTAPVGSAALDEHVAGAEVVAECSCGCPSVGLRTDGPELPEDAPSLTAWGVNDEGRNVEVTLHVVLGRLVELEVWAGLCGGEVRTSLPDADALRSERG